MKKRQMMLVGLGVMLDIMPLYAAPLKANDAVVKKAMQYVPEGSQYITTIKRYNCYEVRFYNQAKEERYEVELYTGNNKVKEFKSEKINTKGSKQVKLTKEEIKKIVLKQHPEAEIKEIKLSNDDGFKKYKIEIKDKNFEGDLEINPETGVILERDFDIKNSETTSNKNQKVISIEKVKQIALQKVPGAIIEHIELDYEKGRSIYEVEMVKGQYEYELKLDAHTGKGIHLYKDLEDWFDEDEWKVLDNSKETLGKIISEQKAKEIAIQKVPGGKIISIEIDEDDNKLYYEIEIIKGNLEYELEIDAVTGKITKIDTDEIDD